MKKIKQMLMKLVGMVDGMERMRDAVRKDLEATKKRSAPLEPIHTMVRPITWLKGMTHGWGNGYIAVYKDRQWPKGDDVFDVHGGITMDSPLFHIDQEDNDIKTYFPEIRDNRQDWMVYGFDCAHYGDSPASCSESYVLNEVANLKVQAEKKCRPV